jgi:ABC-2 type transport system ATP-binding protein
MGDMLAIQTQSVGKSYVTSSGIVHSVEDLSLDIPEGTIFGFLGPNGAGKTTTMKMLVGLTLPTSGSITVAHGNPSDITVRAKIGFMPESPSFYSYLTGCEFLELVAQVCDIDDAQKRIHDVLVEVDLTGREHRQVRTYSKGMLQRLGLAQALLNDPSIIFLDEPLDGLDPLGRAEMKGIVTKLRDQGKTVFMNSHVLADVAEVCDLVSIIDRGRVIASGSPTLVTDSYRDLEDAFVHIIREHRQSLTV